MADVTEDAKEQLEAVIEEQPCEDGTADLAEDKERARAAGEADAKRDAAVEDQQELADVCSKSPEMLRFHTGLITEITQSVRQIEKMLHTAAAMAVVYRSSSSPHLAAVMSGPASVPMMIGSAKNTMKNLCKELYTVTMRPTPGLKNVQGSPDRKHWEILE